MSSVISNLVNENVHYNGLIVQVLYEKNAYSNLRLGLDNHSQLEFLTQPQKVRYPYPTMLTGRGNCHQCDQIG